MNDNNDNNKSWKNKVCIHGGTRNNIVNTFQFLRLYTQHDSIIVEDVYKPVK